MPSRKFLVTAGLVAITTAAGGAAHAQGSPQATLEEVVVTARKREENLQQVPVAVTAISQERMASQGIRTPLDLGRYVPSLSTSVTFSAPTAVTYSIRGQQAADVLLTSSPSVGLYLDNVNVAHPVGTGASLFDLQRVEVLRGPQGTLFGRNTTGGAISIISRGADYSGIHGFISGEVGNHDSWRVGGAVNFTAIDDVLAFRLAYQHWNRDGYGRSLLSGDRIGGGHDDDIVRLSILADPLPNLTSITKVEYARLRNTGVLNTLRQASPSATAIANLVTRAELGVPASTFVSNNLLETWIQPGQFADTKTWHVAEDITWDISDDVRLRWISGYHKLTSFQSFDVDTTPATILTSDQQACGRGIALPPPRNTVPLPFCGPDQQMESYTQEFNLSGGVGGVQWLVGAFGSWEEGEAQVVQASAPRLGTSDGSGVFLPDILTSSWGVYTQNDVKFSDQISLTLGARYSEERQKQSVYQVASYSGATGLFTCQAGTGTGVRTSPFTCSSQVSRQTGHGISYLASVNFQLTPDHLIYVKTARGFRGGALQQRSPALPPVNPEFATDYELGSKMEFFDRRVRLNVDYYHTEYKNKQETKTTIDPLTLRNATFLANAATAKIDGLEVDFNVRASTEWSIYGSGSYLRGKYKSFKCAVPIFVPAGNVNAACPNTSTAPTQTNITINASGFGFINVPHWQYAIGTRYERQVGPGELGGQLDWTWRGKLGLNPLNANPSVAALNAEWADSVGLLNGRIDYTLRDQGVTIALFATNLLNKKYQTTGIDLFGALGVAVGVTNEPRMWGLSIRKSFGSE